MGLRVSEPPEQVTRLAELHTCVLLHLHPPKDRIAEAAGAFSHERAGLLFI